LKCCTCHVKTAIICGSKKKSLAAVKSARFYCHKRLAHLTATSEVGALKSVLIEIWNPPEEEEVSLLKSRDPGGWGSMETIINDCLSAPCMEYLPTFALKITQM